MRIDRKESDKFWKDLIYKNGKLDEEAILNELSDYKFLFEQVPCIYEHITNGMLSKTTYDAKTIISIHDDLHYDKGITKDDIEDMLKRSETFEELKEEIETYFDLGISNEAKQT